MADDESSYGAMPAGPAALVKSADSQSFCWASDRPDVPSGRLKRGAFGRPEMGALGRPEVLPEEGPLAAVEPLCIFKQKT